MAVVVIGIAVGVFLLLHTDNGSSSSSSQPTSAATTAPTTLPSSTGLPFASTAQPGKFSSTIEQTFMNRCVSGANQSYCACALTTLENEFAQDEFLAFEQQYNSGDPTARAKLQEIKDGCRSQLPGG